MRPLNLHFESIKHLQTRALGSEDIVPLKWIEYGFGYVIIRPPYTPYSIYLRGTICHVVQVSHQWILEVWLQDLQCGLEVRPPRVMCFTLVGFHRAYRFGSKDMRNWLLGQGVLKYMAFIGDFEPSG